MSGNDWPASAWCRRACWRRRPPPLPGWAGGGHPRPATPGPYVDRGGSAAGLRVVVLGLVLVALVALLAAWSDASNFSAVVQSLSVSLAGFSTTVATTATVKAKSSITDPAMEAHISSDAAA